MWIKMSTLSIYLTKWRKKKQINRVIRKMILKVIHLLFYLKTFILIVNINNLLVSELTTVQH